MVRLAGFVAFMFVVLIGLQSGVVANAATRATVIGVVDVQVILRDSVAMKSIQTQVEEKRRQYQNDISDKEKSLRDQEQELKRQQSVLAADAFEAKRRDFEMHVAVVQREVQERRRILDQTYGEGLKVVQKELTAIIAELAKERGFTIVLPAGQTLYAEPSLAITDEALTRLNKKMTNVPLQFAPPTAKSKQK